MRLTKTQRAIITTGVHKYVGASVEIHLYGSRLDDTQRGGDVDLLLISPTVITPLACVELEMALVEYLQLPVTVIAYVPTEEPTLSQSIALAEACPID